MLPFTIFDRNRGGEERGLLGIGYYRFTFIPKTNLQFLPDLEPRETSVQGKKIVIVKSEKDFRKNRYRVFVRVLENPIPIVAVVVSMFTLLGLSLIYLTLDKVEKIFDSPAAFTFIAVAAIVTFFVLIKLIQKK